MPSPFAASAVLMAAAASEIEFSCPWCNTRLALSRADFENELAVLCPRCHNPVDLSIQRRLVKAQPSSRPAPSSPLQTPARSATTKPKPPPPSRPSMTEQPPWVGAPPQAPAAAPPPGGQDQKSPSRPPSLADKLDWSRPVDIDGTFGPAPPPGRPPLSTPPGSPAPGIPAASTIGAKRKCPACGFDNPIVPPEFSFGTSQKCSWCNKPLPPV